MAKSASDAVLDGSLDIVSTATEMTLCSAEPTTYAEATGTGAGEYAMCAPIVIGPGDFTIAADVNGRKITVGAQPTINMTVAGNVTHLALCDGADLLEVTTTTALAVIIGSIVNVPAWKINATEPT